NALLDAVGRGQDEHRRGAAARAKLLQYLQPVQLGQSEVEDEQVEFLAAERGVGFRAGGDVIDRIAPLAQRAKQSVGQHLVVFRDQDSHGVSPMAALRRRLIESLFGKGANCRSRRTAQEKALYKHPASAIIAA